MFEECPSVFECSLHSLLRQCVPVQRPLALGARFRPLFVNVLCGKGGEHQPRSPKGKSEESEQPLASGECLSPCNI